MKISEIIINEGILDALKFVGRAAYQAAGGKVDKNDPAISRANLEYVRKQLGQELYKQFMSGVIRQGLLTKSGQLRDPNTANDIVNMAAGFLKDAYRVYITTPERFNALSTEIDTAASRSSFNELKNLFYRANATYLEMLQDVEATTSTNIRNIISQLSAGINASFNVPKYQFLKQYIKDLLSDLSSQSAYQVRYPFTNSAMFKRNPALAALDPVSNQDDKAALILYQKVIETIYNLSTSQQLTLDLANEFEAKI